MKITGMAMQIRTVVRYCIISRLQVNAKKVMEIDILVASRSMKLIVNKASI